MQKLSLRRLSWLWWIFTNLFKSKPSPQKEKIRKEDAEKEDTIYVQFSFEAVKSMDQLLDIERHNTLIGSFSEREESVFIQGAEDGGKNLNPDIPHLRSAMRNGYLSIESDVKIAANKLVAMQKNLLNGLANFIEGRTKELELKLERERTQEIRNIREELDAKGLSDKKADRELTKAKLSKTEDLLKARIEIFEGGSLQPAKFYEVPMFLFLGYSALGWFDGVVNESAYASAFLELLPHQSMLIGISISALTILSSHIAFNIPLRLKWSQWKFSHKLQCTLGTTIASLLIISSAVIRLVSENPSPLMSVLGLIGGVATIGFSYLYHKRQDVLKVAREVDKYSEQIGKLNRKINSLEIEGQDREAELEQQFSGANIPLKVAQEKRGLETLVSDYKTRETDLDDYLSQVKNRLSTTFSNYGSLYLRGYMSRSANQSGYISIDPLFPEE